MNDVPMPEGEMSAIENLIWGQFLIETTKRTIVCEPEMESRVKEALKSHGLADWPVIVNPACPKGKIFVMDVSAMDAAMNESIQHGIRRSLFHKE